MRERPLDICGTPAHRPAGKLAEARQTGEFEHTAFRTECPVAKRQEPIQQNVKNLFPPASPVSDPQPDSLPDLDHHLGTDRGFLSAYARALAALAMADGPVSMARFAALTEIARNSVTALVGTQIFFALEKNLAWNPALAALQKAAQTVSEPDRRGALEQAYPLLRCAGHRARPLARQLAGALRVPVSMADLGELPPEEDQGLLDRLQEVLRVTARSRTETDRLVEFGRYIGEPEVIERVRAYRAGREARSALMDVLATAVANTERSISDYEASALLAKAAAATTASLMDTALALQQQIGQRRASMDARIRFERDSFAQEIEDLAHDAGNGLEVAIADRLNGSNWKDKDVWASIARTQFGQEAERRIDRAIRRRESSLLLLQEELRLFRNDLRLAAVSVLDRQHHATLARQMPRMRLRTRLVNAVDTAANATLVSGTAALAVGGSAAYFLGLSAVLPLVAPAAPVVGGAMLVAGLFKWLTDADKRKLAEIRDKRQAIEGLLRSRLQEAFASFSGQLDQLQADFAQAEAALLQPVLLNAQAACRLPGLQQALAERVIGQSRQMIRGVREDLHRLERAA